MTRLYAAFLFALATPALAGPPTAIQVTGQLLAVNQQTQIPRELFGVHAVPLTPQNIADMGIECTRQIQFNASGRPIEIGKDGALAAPYDKLITIDCQNDRYVPATVLTNPNYADYYTKLGTAYATATKAHPEYPFTVEFWNEAYLNWASRSYGDRRSNYFPGYYDLSKAVDGGPVTIKGHDKPLTYMRWRRLWARGEDGKIYFGVKLPPNAKVGDTFRGRSPWYWTERDEQTFTAVEAWHVQDPSTGQWFSSKQNLDFYLWMFLPYAKAIKLTNPKVAIVAGWDFGLHQGNYSVWKDLTQPLIDAAPQYIDGISEHHYGVDTRQVTSWYEIIATYSMAKYGRWIKGYNTECDGSLDPAVHGPETAKAEEADPVKKQLAGATYALRDILELAYLAPDKVGSRTHHMAMPQSGPGAALRFLKDLRGALVATSSPDPELWPVAAINSQNQLVVTLFNNDASERAVTLSLAAPANASFGGGQLCRLAPEGTGLTATSEPVAAAGTSASVACTVPAHSAIKLVLPLTGTPGTAVQVHRRQFFPLDPLVVQPVTASKPLSLTLRIPAAVLAKVQAARLRVVLDQNVNQPVTVKLNDTPVAVPNRPFTTDVAVPVKLLKESNTLTFSTTASYQLNAASVLVDTP